MPDTQLFQEALPVQSRPERNYFGAMSFCLKVLARQQNCFLPQGTFQIRFEYIQYAADQFKFWTYRPAEERSFVRVVFPAIAYFIFVRIVERTMPAMGDCRNRFVVNERIAFDPKSFPVFFKPVWFYFYHFFTLPEAMSLPAVHRIQKCAGSNVASVRSPDIFYFHYC